MKFPVFYTYIATIMLLGFAAQSYATDAPAKVNCLKTHILKKSARDTNSIGDADIKRTLHLEVASDPETREHGLMERKTLAPCDGMAFFFPALNTTPETFAPQKFWMKNTLIPLDILFLDANHTIIHIATAKPLSLKSIGPDAPVATAIEIAGGRAMKDNIKIGDRVFYEIAGYTWNIAR